MEKYVKPEMEVIELTQDDVITASSSCIIVSWTVTYEDAGGNQYSQSGSYP